MRRRSDYNASMIISALALVLSLSGLLLGFYTFQRVLFLLWNYSYIAKATTSDIFIVFLNGLRFDLYVLVFLNGIPLLLAIYCSSKIQKKQIPFLAGLIYFLHLPFVILNTIDTEFVNFTSRRFNIGNIGLITEAQGKISGFITTYLPLIFLQLLVLTLITYLFFKISKYYYSRRLESPLKYYVTFIFILIPFCVIAARGGFQSKPLNPSHSVLFNEPHLNLAILNTTFTMIRERPSNFISRKDYFKSFEDLKPYLNGYSKAPSLFTKNLAQEKTNVVIIILESFSLEYMGKINGKNFTPFLDSLSDKGLFFPETYANGFRSIEAISSILGGIPSLMPEPFVRSPFFNNALSGIGSYFTDIGYETSFFHGGVPGTMFFDLFTKKAGFQKYYSSEDYPNQKDNDGTWGIYDEPFFDFMVSELDKNKKPFFSTIFTLSSHHPYNVPDKYKDILPIGELPILRSISYTDQALKGFFQAASKKDWYNNTLFIITADHTQIPYLPEFKSLLGRYRIPLILYHPKMQFPEVNLNRITQHVDIIPTLLDMFKIEDSKKIKFGKSVFIPEDTYVSILYDKTLIYKDKSNIITMLDNDFKFYDSKDLEFKKPLPPMEENSLPLQQFKSTIQYYNNGLSENHLYFE